MGCNIAHVVNYQYAGSKVLKEVLLKLQKRTAKHQVGSLKRVKALNCATAKWR
jgi:hypothetical protein